jgi:hypothetical protein
MGIVLKKTLAEDINKEILKLTQKDNLYTLQMVKIELSDEFKMVITRGQNT